MNPLNRVMDWWLGSPAPQDPRYPRLRFAPPGRSKEAEYDQCHVDSIGVVQACQRGANPRRWFLTTGDGYRLGIATESGNQTITIGWHPGYAERLADARTRYVDFAAFRDSFDGARGERFCDHTRIPWPVRIHLDTRTKAEERAELRRQRKYDW